MDKNNNTREAEIRKWWNGDFTMTSASLNTESLNEKPIFVIQEHQSLFSHFDFRLELKDSVLKSWVLPENPFCKKDIESDAILTNDHYIPWAYFEGSIHKGKYGKGAVMVWDIGKVEFKYISDDLYLQDYKNYGRESRAIFRLEGKKINGDFLLQYEMIKKNHIYWSLKSINNSFKLKVSGESFNHSALSGSSMESIREETKRNKGIQDSRVHIRQNYKL